MAAEPVEEVGEDFDLPEIDMPEADEPEEETSVAGFNRSRNLGGDILRRLMKAVLYFIATGLLIVLGAILIQPPKDTAGLVLYGAYHTLDSIMYQKYDNGVISSYGNVSEAEYESMCGAFELLPDFVRESFTEDGWKIVISSYPIDTIVDAPKNAIAVARMGEKGEHIIYVYRRFARPAVLLHEIGHYYDEKNGYASNGIDNIRLKERTSMQALESELTKERALDHNTENASEYFATAFAAYLLMPSELRDICPETYIYVKNVAGF